MMPSVAKLRVAGLLFSCLTGTVCHAQDLTPRAYVITPIRSNAVILIYSYFTGSRRELPERLRGVAVFLAGRTQVVLVP